MSGEVHGPGRVAATLLLAAGIAAAGPAAAADDWPEDEFALTDAVNDGELAFVAPRPDSAVLHADTLLVVGARSKRDGWLGMRQCYRHFDPIERTDVVYAYREMRGLRVIRQRNIGVARIEDGGVALTGVGADAELCVAAEVRLLRDLGGGRFRIDSGPYHRRFLDGYYPIHVSLRVRLDGSGLLLERVTPAATEGFRVSDSAAEIGIDAWFEGRLLIGLEFSEPAHRSDQFE